MIRAEIRKFTDENLLLQIKRTKERIANVHICTTNDYVWLEWLEYEHYERLKPENIAHQKQLERDEYLIERKEELLMVLTAGRGNSIDRELYELLEIEREPTLREE